MIAGRRMGPSYGAPNGAASVREALRVLRDSGLERAVAGAPLEVQSRGDDPPRLESATPIEGSAIAVRCVPDAPIAGVRAFLDGIQRSQVLAHAGTVPIVYGAVAAAIRERTDRRLRTWDRPRVSQALYAPLGMLDPVLAEALHARFTVVDPFSDDPAIGAVSRHPLECTARALTAVHRAREAAESALITEWVRRGDGPLLVDGGISGNADGARHPGIIGVVKSHRTLYAGDAVLPLVLGLREGERTTAVTVSSPRRSPVASWYLRLREPAGRSPLFGLVRVEVALQEGLTARADLVSRWLLAERAPVALPDQRWDVMVYGIRECEQYLTAILR